MNTFFCDACVEPLYRFNEWLTAALHNLASPAFTQFFVYITDLFDPINIFMYCLVLIMALWLHKKNTHMKQFLFALSVTSISVLALKFGLKIPRPPHPMIEEVGYSFASAHAAISAVFILICFHAYKKHIPNKILRMLFLAACLVLILLVGISRVYLGVHYATDVIGGYLVGLIVFEISVLMFG
jgi:undecaprenyl-diphosphatase